MCDCFITYAYKDVIKSLKIRNRLYAHKSLPTQSDYKTPNNNAQVHNALRRWS